MEKKTLFVFFVYFCVFFVFFVFFLSFRFIFYDSLVQNASAAIATENSVTAWRLRTIILRAYFWTMVAESLRVDLRVFGGEQGRQALAQVLVLCPFSPHPEQVLLAFLVLTTLVSLKMFMHPARPSRGLLAFLVLTTLVSLKMFMHPARPSRGLLTFLAFREGSIALSSAATRCSAKVGSIALSSAATRCSAGVMVVRNRHVRLL
jgi:hypothetical protein